MKKGIFKTIKAFALGVAALALASCGNLFDDSDSSGNALASGEKAAVTFNFAAPSRTALPSVKLSSYTYTITATDSNSKTTTLATKQSLTNDTLTASIDAGTYTFTATAYSGDMAVLTGTSSETTISSSNTSVSITLKAATGGYGTVSVTLKIAESLGASKVTAGIYDDITATDSGSEQKLDTTTNSGYTTVTYSNTSVESGSSKFVIFFIYDSSNKLIMPYAESVYVVNGLISSSEYTINGETFVATVTLQKNGSDWADSGAAVKLVNASDSTDTITLTATSGKATYTGNATAGSTYTVYVNGKATEKTINSSSASATLNYLVPSLYPAQGATDAFADTQLIMTFKSEPALVSDSTVTITSGSTTVDSISVNSTSKDESQTAQTTYIVNVGNSQLVRVDDNSVYIQPHYNGSTSATKLGWGTSYTVDVSDIISVGSSYDGMLFEDGTSTWSFTTKSEPAISTSSAITVSNAISSNTADYFSVYGAMFAAAAKSSGTYEIDIAAGTYYELVNVKSKGADIILKGTGTADKGSDVVIEYVNNVYLASSLEKIDSSYSYSSMAQRVSFYFAGGDLTLENLKIENLTARKTVYSANGVYYDTSLKVSESNSQAEALMFNSGSGHTLNAYNSSFKSLQDTLYTTGKVWFYNCYVAGDVDFIWGTSDAALFEKCSIECLNTSATSSYLFETRVGSTSGTTVGKGYVLFNSTVTVDSGVTAYYGRRATAKSSTSYYDQVAIVDTTFSGAGSLAAARWYIGNEPEEITDSTYYKYGSHVDVGWKEYNVTNSTATSSTTSTSAYGTIGSTEYSNEYSGRHAILNRFFTKGDGSTANSGSYAKDTTTNWDIDTLISSRKYSVDTDSSKETLSGESETKSVVYDFTASSAVSTSYAATSGSGDALTTASWTYKDTTYGWYSNKTSATLAVPVTGDCTVTLYNSYSAGAGTISIAVSSGSVSPTSLSVVKNDSKATPNELSTAYTGSGGKVTFTFPSSIQVYIAKVVVTYTSSSSSSDDDTTNYISLSDTPTGYATIDTSKFTNTITVSTKSDLVSYAAKGGYLIYVNGMIDMSEGMLPSTAGGTTDDLNSFVQTTTTSLNSSNSTTYPNVYSTYTDFQSAYAALCSETTDDKSSSSTATTLSQTLWGLNKAYGNKIKLSPASNTAIIGLTSSSGIKGGTIRIIDVSNVVIRNLTIQDAYDPFPHHEKNDGFNAQWDAISIQTNSSSTTNIWIDHCTVEDTMKYITVTTKSGSEKWQTYDGLCDITKSATNVVVSYNIFKNHDKTMLIGSGSSDLSGGYITIHHNEFLNCGQRLPMTTYPYMHIFNNYYLRDSDAYYSQQACIVGRYSAYTIVAENNYFGSGVTKCLTTSTSATGSCYASGNVFEESSTSTGLATAASAPFTPSYTYSDILESASDAKTTVETNSGAGVWTVKK